MTPEVLRIGTDDATAAARRSLEPAVDRLGRHVTDDEVALFAADSLTPSMCEAIGLHLNTCADCLAKVAHLVDQGSLWHGTAGEARLQALRDSIEITSADNLPTEAPQRCQDDRPEPSITDLLLGSGVIERGFDYILPSEVHVDTHFNAGRLCESEDALTVVATRVADALRPHSFDTLIVTGWTMAVVGRRVLKLLETLHPSESRRRLVQVDGYDSLTFLAPLMPRASTAILSDIRVTGGLIGRIEDEIQRQKAAVVAAGVIIDCGDTWCAGFPTFSLHKAAISSHPATSCPRCRSLQRKRYNPLTCRMEVESLQPRSPSALLASSPDIRELWQQVEDASAFRLHFVEGMTHHVSFVDTGALVTHPTVGPVVLERLFEALGELRDYELIVVPNRARARLLIERLLPLWRQHGYVQPSVMVVDQVDKQWVLSDWQRVRMASRSVVIVDSAVAHGDTMDAIRMACRSAGATSVGAATLLSRLSRSQEIAVNELFEKEFRPVYRLPIRPYVVRTRQCPFCARKRQLKRDADNTGFGALVDLASYEQQRFPRREDELPHGIATRTVEPLQLALPGVDNGVSSFLRNCRPSVAAGVALHALFEGDESGTPPLVLPELFDSTIPVLNRAAMLECLPTESLRWGTNELGRTLERCLEDNSRDLAWVAAAELLARQSQFEWTDTLLNQLRLGGASLAQQSDLFWNRLAYVLYRLSTKNDLLRSNLRRDLLFARNQLVHGGEHYKPMAARYDRVIEVLDLLDAEPSLT